MNGSLLLTALVLSVIYNGITPVAGDAIDDLITGLIDDTGTLEGIIQGSTTTAKPDVCEPGQTCTPKHLCTNASVTGELGIDIRFDVSNPCVDYLLQCCYLNDVIKPPPTRKPYVPTTVTEKLPPVTERPPQPSICGIRQPEGVGFRIVNASNNEAEYGEFPWMLAVVQRTVEADEFVVNRYKCGASLIHPKVALTAAHCVRSIPAIELVVRAGEWDTQTTNEIYPTQDRRVAEVVVHADFYRAGLHNDIALLILDSAMELDEVVQTICLPDQNTNFDRQRCFVSGWGRNQYGSVGPYQVILKKVDLPVVPSAECQNIMRETKVGKLFVLHKSFICAGGEPGKDACQGDGGSPLICPILGTKQYQQAGIVAWGVGCGDNIPGIYVKVALFRKWIDEQMKQRKIGAF